MHAAKFALAEMQGEPDYVPVKAGKNVRYVVPHKLDRKALEGGDVQLQLRVTRPIEEDVWLEVRTEEKSVVRRSERYARPGEMVTIMLKPSMADLVREAVSLTVDVYPKAEA